MIIYKGRKTQEVGSQQIIIQITPQTKEFLKHRLIEHSPTGMSWGYSGSGPSDLALNILLDFYDRYYDFLFETTKKELAYKHYQSFKSDLVAKWGNSFQITNEEIQEWLIQQAKKK